MNLSYWMLLYFLKLSRTASKKMGTAKKWGLPQFCRLRSRQAKLVAVPIFYRPSTTLIVSFKNSLKLASVYSSPFASTAIVTRIVAPFTRLPRS